jgi:linoleoyl-CoA desaturase
LALKLEWIDDYRFIIIGRLDQHRVPRPGTRPLLTFLIGRALFLSWVLAVPMLFHPVAAVLFFYFAGALVLGMAIVLVFMIPHLVAESEFPIPREDTGMMEKPWAVHQALVTVNFSRGNRILTWMLGGLNYHKEHHLFPLISHANYPAMSAVVEKTCRDFGLPYRCYPSFAAGVAAHYRWLKRMGSAD